MEKNKNLVVNICKVFFASYDHISFLPGKDQFHKTILFPEDRSWNEIYFTSGTAEFSEARKNNDQGDLLEQTLKIIIPGEDEENSNALFDLLHPLVLLMKLSNGLYKVFGSPDVPAKMIENRTDGAKISNTEILFSCMAQEYAWITPPPDTGGLSD